MIPQILDLLPVPGQMEIKYFKIFIFLKSLRKVLMDKKEEGEKGKIKINNKK